MNKRRQKLVRITVSSLIVIVLSFGFLRVSESNAKEGAPTTPGQKIKQIVHEYNELRKNNIENKEQLKQEFKKQKKDVIEEVKGIKDQDNEENEDPTATSIPSPSPTKPQPTIKIPTITIEPSPVPTAKFPRPTVSPKYNSCLESGGTWRGFPNSCVDSCALAENPGLMCLQVLTEGCDCGPTACWNGSQCVDNPGVKGVKTTPTPTIEVPPPIDKDPVCGNGICEPGEAGSYNCPVCDEASNPCPLRACLHEPGTCPQDCGLTPIEPAI